MPFIEDDLHYCLLINFLNARQVVQSAFVNRCCGYLSCYESFVVVYLPLYIIHSSPFQFHPVYCNISKITKLVVKCLCDQEIKALNGIVK